jgi:hypothetical protein
VEEDGERSEMEKRMRSDIKMEIRRKVEIGREECIGLARRRGFE